MREQVSVHAGPRARGARHGRVCDSAHPGAGAFLPAAAWLYLRLFSSCVNTLPNKWRALVNDCR